MVNNHIRHDRAIERMQALKRTVPRLLLAALLIILPLSACGAPGLPHKTDEPIRVEAPDFTAESESNLIPPETTPPEPKETRITFLAAGDNIIHENVFTDAKNRAKNGEKYNFTDMYEGVAAMIADADFALINQETPIAGAELGITGYPNFNSPKEAGEALVEVGFDIINVANNHMLDKLERGYRNLLDFWHSQPVTLIGGHYDKADYENIRIVEKDGIKIALLSYTYGTNDHVLPSSSPLYIPYIQSAEIVRMIDRAETMADLVFVVMHWGVDGGVNVNNEQKTLAAAITNAGADVIIGMHSHTVQPIEWLARPDGGKTLCIYSLGNFLSTQLDNLNLVAGMVTFDIVKNEDGVKIEKPVWHTTVTHYNQKRLGLQIYRFEDYTEALAAAHGTRIVGNTAAKREFSLDWIKNYVTKNIAPEFLPESMK